jgi:hypothetical protein
MICRHLENSEYHEHDWQEFWRELKIRDAIRNEDFEITFPEYYEVIKQFI